MQKKLQNKNSTPSRKWPKFGPCSPTITWRGWDSISPIVAYELEVFEMRAFGEEMGLEFSPVVSETLDEQASSTSFTLQGPGEISLYNFEKT